VLGRTVDDAVFRGFWDSVAAYNWVRRLLEPAEKVRQEDLDEPDALAAFVNEILPSLRPDLVLVFSRQVWNSLPTFHAAAKAVLNSEALTV
jgi:hypothetical protein